MLSDVIVKSAIIAGEDGTGAPPPNMAGFEFGVDPNIDPELALVRTPLNHQMHHTSAASSYFILLSDSFQALRVSMEEQRARQEKDAQSAVEKTAAETAPPPAAGTGSTRPSLTQALMLFQY